jgi:hypothetical protein
MAIVVAKNAIGLISIGGAPHRRVGYIVVSTVGWCPIFSDLWDHDPSGLP